eukprot:COSAG01_NODE_4094_length_5355_cov_51.835807_3_plen_160_part_00
MRNAVVSPPCPPASTLLHIGPSPRPGNLTRTAQHATQLECLACAEAYANLFPSWELALQAEQLLKQTEPRPACEWPLAAEEEVRPLEMAAAAGGVSGGAEDGDDGGELDTAAAEEEMAVEEAAAAAEEPDEAAAEEPDEAALVDGDDDDDAPTFGDEES